jgi:ATP-dependent protease Clp ATPase subunit
MLKRKLACSFCGRSAADVEKLVAGPRVYICDRSAAEAVRIMNEPAPIEPDARRIRKGWFGASHV